MKKPKYTIKPVNKGYQLTRPDGSVVNNTTYAEYWQADRKLKTLIALGYCI